MKCFRNLFLLFFISLFALNCVSEPTQNQIPQVEPPVLNSYNFCELINDPNKFDGKIVQTQTILLSKSETAILYHRDCIDEKKQVWWEIKENPINDKLDPFFNPDSVEYKKTGIIRVDIELIGKFKVKKNVGFGHLNSFNYLFEISEIKTVKNVDLDYPYPWK